ncbi:MAG: hypothetical protein RID53_07610 [Coleofasciculus sp. B1-GNL1-01]|uniref:hypothetical protein n=1 Tax=Coleofasciculus sp. B1-GNL1-01 TaxID=3068484 RepID=UPI0032FFD1F3
MNFTTPNCLRQCSWRQLSDDKIKFCIILGRAIALNPLICRDASRLYPIDWEDITRLQFICCSHLKGIGKKKTVLD